MLQVERIVNSIFDSNTWLLSEAESSLVWLVDCGDIASILEKIKGKTVAGVLLTHAHFDHIYGLPELIKHFPECKLYTNVPGQKALSDAKMNMSLYHETPIIVDEKPVITCSDGDEIELSSDVKAWIYETPGHNPSCLCFLIGHYLFTGVAYIPGVKPVTNLPGGKKEDAKQSYKRIEAMLQDRIVCPGHAI